MFPVLAALPAIAEPRVDPVLRQMVPPRASSLVGVHMDRVRPTGFYRRIIESGKLSHWEKFVRETGFNPGRDVRELLFANTFWGRVLVARGRFTVPAEAPSGATLVRHGDYNVWSYGNSGFCILDNTLAAAGDMRSLLATLDEWTSGTHHAADPFLQRARFADSTTVLWGVARAFDGLLADTVTGSTGGVDFSKIFRRLTNIWFEMDFSAGLRARVGGSTATEQDAVNLRDTIRGLVGIGRLTVPENQPDVLRMWDGITAEPESRSLALKVDVPVELVEQLLKLAGAVPGRDSALGFGAR